VIRAATADDAAAILAVHRASRAAAYARLGPAEQAAGKSTEQSWRESLQRSAAAWVWEAGGEVIAFAVVEGDVLGGLYVLPGFEGRGIGSALLAEAVAAGARSLWVYEEHPSARAFYERHGWVAEPDTAYVGADWALQRPALRYRLP
jgi:GNAT superfamily N-acetyltransferase